MKGLVHTTPVLLHNARIVLPDRTAEKASLLIHDDRIAQVLEPAPSQLPTADSVIDLSGLTLFPGFIDAHIHGAVGVDTNNTDEGGLHKVARFLAQNGVTAWLPTLVPDSEDHYRKSIETIDELISEQSAEKELTGHSQVLGVHYEGPFVSENQCGALRSRFFKTFLAGDELKSLPRLREHGAVHLTTVAPEIEGGIALVKELVKQGWIVSIGHTRAEFDLLDKAFEAGARHMTHFMNAMAPLHHRSPGPIAWGLSRDEVTCDVIADGIHLDRRMLQLLLKLKGAARLTLISDAVAAAGLGDGDYQIWGETINVKEGRTRNSHGSIAGSVITMLDAVRTMKSLGVSEVDLARMGSTNPAQLLGIDDDCGTIEEGKRADLVALNEQGEVVLTMIGGAIVFDARQQTTDNRQLTTPDGSQAGSSEFNL